MKFEANAVWLPETKNEPSERAPQSEGGFLISKDVPPVANYEDQADERAREADLAVANRLLEKIKSGSLGEVEPDFESDPTLVLFERMNHPIIQEHNDRASIKE